VAERRSRLARLRDIGVSLIGAVFIVTIFSRFVLTPFRVDQTSMAPTLEPGDHLLVDRLGPIVFDYAYEDIVVFLPPDDWRSSDAVPYVKRIIGLPGDIIEIENGSVRRNGVVLDESYIAPGTTTAARYDILRFEVGPAQFFVMGDHRLISDDSRGHGAIPADAVIGRVVVRYLPFDRATIDP
jgi:signal peptidase I